MRPTLERLAGVGLRWRLAGWVTVVILACITIAFVAVYRGTGTQVGRQIDREIAGDASDLAHSLASARSLHSPAQVFQAATRYVRGQPFSASSTLLFVIVPGAGASTNRPELLGGEAPDNGETPTEQAQENRLSARLLTVGNGYSTLPLPDVGNLRLLKRTVRLPAAAKPADRVVIGVGEPLAAVIRAQEGVSRAFILAGILALAGALLGAYLIGTRLSRPLRRIATVAARVDAGDLHPRILAPHGGGNEVRVLADAFNHMLDRLTEAFAGQREFVADASHELRTPLTVIRGQLEVLAAQQDPAGDEVRRVERLVQNEVARISRLVDDLLLLAKSEQAEFLRIEPIDLPTFVSELWHPTTALANAIEHTANEHGRVSMRVDPVARERVRFVVEDDGPGIPASQRERVFDRFHRTDTARDRTSGGTGLGLAIVDAIAKAHDGRVTASQSYTGGARIELELPRFTPAPRRPSAPQTQTPAVGALSGSESIHTPGKSQGGRLRQLAITPAQKEARCGSTIANPIAPREPSIRTR
jgi:two-component system, OmpR family, sensor kinase